MGQLGKALDMLLGGVADDNVVKQTSSCVKPEAALTGAHQEIDNYSTLETVYHLLKGDGIELVGRPDKAFAAFNRETGVVSVLAARDELVDIVPYRTVCVLAALNYAKEQGATFSVCGDDVICVVNDISARGSSYGDAALRALLKHQLQSATLSSCS